MTTPSFSELLAKYMTRAGISDSELARTIGVQRQTIFRWKEGIVARPRVREDVLRCASKLRLTHAERDQLLLAAGFPPEVLPVPAADAEPPAVIDLPASSAPPVVTTIAEIATNPESPTVAPLSSLGAQRSWSRWVGIALGVVLLGVGWLIWSGRSTPLNLGEATPAVSDLLVRRADQTAVAPAPQLITLEPLSTTLPTAPSMITPPWPTASPQEMLLVIAPFAGYSDKKLDVAIRIEEALQAQLDDLRLSNTAVKIWSSALQNRLEAAQVLSRTQATIVIWGAYDDGRVQVNWFVRNAEKAEKSDFSLTRPEDLFVTINEDVPKEMQSVALYTFGRLLQSEGNLPKAERAYLQGLALTPNSDRLAALLNFYLGRIISAEKKPPNLAAQIQNYDAALDYYAAAYQHNPRLYNALYNRGTVWLSRARVLTNTVEVTASLSAAIGDLSTFLTVVTEQPAEPVAYRRVPEFANAYFNRGSAYYLRKQPEDALLALADLTQFTELAPQQPAGWYQRALVQIHIGTHDGWVDDLKRTLELAPTYTAAYHALCWGYALEQQAEAALPYCDQAVSIQQTQADPENTSHDALGIVYAQLGRYAEAIAAFEEYLRWIQAYHAAEYSQRRGPEVESWITILRTQQNPFDLQLLASLR